MKQYYNSLMLFIAFFIIFEGILIYYTDFLKCPYWGDESHFIETIHSFGEEISICIGMEQAEGNLDDLVQMKKK